MTLTVGCTYANCECDPCCCSSNPNCDTSKGDDLKFYEDTTCCYGPWDAYVREKGAWKLHHTLFCLSDVYQYFDTGMGKGMKEYVIVLAGKPVDWDAIEDPDTPECWFEVDPYSASGDLIIS